MAFGAVLYWLIPGIIEGRDSGEVLAIIVGTVLAAVSGTLNDLMPETRRDVHGTTLNGSSDAVLEGAAKIGIRQGRRDLQLRASQVSYWDFYRT